MFRTGVRDWGPGSLAYSYWITGNINDHMSYSLHCVVQITNNCHVALGSALTFASHPVHVEVSPPYLPYINHVIVFVAILCRALQLLSTWQSQSQAYSIVWP